MNTNSTSKRTVATVKKSTEIRSVAWLARKARQVGDGGLRERTRYFSTVDLATSMPSFRSSPAMRSEPHAGLAAEILRMRQRSCFGTAGRPRFLPARVSRVQ
jgi:hypothetical protein